MTDSRTHPAAPDAVALTGALVALAGAALLPLAELRANRLVPGTLESLGVAGALALPVWVALAVGFAAAFAPASAARPRLARLAAWGLVGATAWALGAACSRLLEGQPAVARVSIGAGAWVLLAGAAVLGFAGRDRAFTPAGGSPKRGERAAAGRTARVVVMRLLAPAAGIAAVVLAFTSGGLDQLSLAREYAVRADSFWQLLLGHVTLSAAALAAGLAIGVPLGLAATRNRRVRAVALGVTGIIQTVPSLALLGLLVVPLAALGAAYPVLRELGIRGIGAAPGLIALTLYALLPIVRNTYVGLSEVDQGAIDAGRGMGMSSAQLLTRVELPLALPLIIEGVRTAAVLLVGITTLTVFAGARNLGILIFEGLGQFAPDLILLGAIPTIALALVADLGLSALGRALTPEGVRAP